MLLGWLVSTLDGVYFIAAALCLYYGRKHIAAGAAPYLRAAAVLIGVLVLARIIGSGWAALSSSPAQAGTESRTLVIARTLLGLECLPVVLAFLVGLVGAAQPIHGAVGILGTRCSPRRRRARRPRALENPLAEGTAAQIEEFSDWRDAIPPGDNVFIVPRYYTAGFAWFTLQRPSYLTVDQSSGVIFSRATAVEIRRRSEVLLPMEEPDWRLLSRRATHAGKFDAAALPLTRDRLVRICADPELNFVVAKENVGFRAPPSSSSGHLERLEPVRLQASEFVRTY